MDIFCDSSFLMALVSNPITCRERVEDELGKLKFIVPSSVLKELELIKKRAGPKRSKTAGAQFKWLIQGLKLQTLVNLIMM